MTTPAAAEPEQSRFSPRDVLRLLRRHWIVIAVCVVLGIALGGLWTLTQTRLYQSETTAVVTAGVNENLGVALTADNLAKSKATQYQELARSRAVAEGAVEASGLELSPNAALGAMNVANPNDTAQLRITVIQPDPADARVLADAWVTSLAEQVGNVENQTLPGMEQPDSVEQTGTPAESIIRVMPLVAANEPTAPVSPNVRMALALGGLLGLLVGLAIATVRTLADRRITSASTLTDRFGLTVLGTIPAVDRAAQARRKRQAKAAPAEGAPVDGTSRAMLLNRLTGRGADLGGKHETFRVAESFKELRTNLQFLSPDNPPRIIIITSSLPGEGKSTVASNIALTIAESGRRTVLVDADLRRPMIAKSFGAIGTVGLTDVVRGTAEVDDVLQDVGGVEGLQLLTSGPIPPNPSEILASERLESVLRHLAEDALVIVDAPPLLPVTDASILAAKYDGAVLVVTAGQSTVDEVGKATDNLAKVNGRVLGAVLNKVPTTRSESSYYQYYGKEYYYASEGVDQTDPYGSRGQKPRGRGRGRKRTADATSS